MSMSINLPVGFAQCSYFFGGPACPSGAAITFGVDHGPLVLTPAQVATALNTAWNNHLDSVTNSLVTHLGTRVKFGPMDDGPFALVAQSNNGQVVSSASPPNVTYLVRKTTDFGGKAGTGRMYVPGLAESEVDEAGVVSSAKLTSLSTAWAAWATTVGTTAGLLVLLHSFGTFTNSDGEEVAVPARAPSPIRALLVDGKAATQRRRLRR